MTGINHTYITLLKALNALPYTWRVTIIWDDDAVPEDLEIRMAPMRFNPCLDWTKDTNLAFIICLQRLGVRGLYRSPLMIWLRIPLSPRQREAFEGVLKCSLTDAIKKLGRV